MFTSLPLKETDAHKNGFLNKKKTFNRLVSLLKDDIHKSGFQYYKRIYEHQSLLEINVYKSILNLVFMQNDRTMQYYPTMLKKTLGASRVARRAIATKRVYEGLDGTVIFLINL